MPNPRRTHSRLRKSQRGSTAASGSKPGLRHEQPGRDVNLTDGFISEALLHVDYKPRPGGETSFSRRVGYSGHQIPWSGAFIDCVARDSKVTSVPACVNSVSGLAEFKKRRRTHSEPKPGDIVFFSFSSPGTNVFGQPHVGIVTRVIDSEIFESCEAQVDNSVRVLIRHVNDVICFGRPDFTVRPGKRKSADGHTSPPIVTIERVRAGSYADIYNLQRSLSMVVDLRNYKAGEYDVHTQAAYRRWQRLIGYVGDDVTGALDPSSLTRLARETKIFRTSHSEN